MFADEESVEWPPNPAVDNEEAMRRAVQVFYLMNEWANVYLGVKDGELTPEQAIDQFNDKIAPVGFAYKLEMDMDPRFLIGLVIGHEDILNRLAAVEAEENKE